MNNKFHQFLLMLAIALMASFTWMMPAQQGPEGNRFVPECVYELPPVGTLTLSATTATALAAKNTEVCIDIKAKDFKQILSMQYSMNWDSSVLKFKELRNFALPGMGKNNFGFHLVDKGILTYSWYEPNLLGSTKPDGTAIYQVCFEVVGEAGSSSKFEITGKPTIIEITNASGTFLELKTEEGKVDVGGNGGTKQ